MKSLRKVGNLNYKSATTHEMDHQEIFLIPVEKIDLEDSSNIRDSYDLSGLEELAKSIEENGLLEPIGIDGKINPNGKYTLIFGFRRTLAISKFTNIKMVRAITVLPKSDKNVVQLLENIQREDLTDYEIAKSLYAIKKNTQSTIDELAKRINKSVDWVKKKMVHANILNDIESISEPEQLDTIKNLTTQQISSISKLEKEDKLLAIEEIKNGKARVKDIRSLSDALKVDKKIQKKKKPSILKEKNSSRLKLLKSTLKKLYLDRKNIEKEIAKIESQLKKLNR